MNDRIITVEEYICNNETWQQALSVLREIMFSFQMEETIKWGAPVYAINGKNVAGLRAFKSYVALWFFQGALLKDESNKLINAQEGTTKALRQWRFNDIKEIEQNKDLIYAYVQEAVTNQKHGKAIKPDRNKPLNIPDALKEALSKDTKLIQAFDGLSLSRRREYVDYIGEAKREETKQKRLQTCIPLILEGRGLNDKYRK